MAGYKVSYKILRQQGEDMKIVAKMIDGYAERVSQINGKLGSDNMLAEVRGSLTRLKNQLGQSRAVLNTSGELLIKTVESYDSVETRQVGKVDGTKAHNRDFYKRPVVVASAGGAVGGAASGIASASAPAPAATTTTSTTTVNYTDNTTNNTYNAAPEYIPAQPAQADIADSIVSTGFTSSQSAEPSVPAESTDFAPADSGASGISGAGIAAGVIGGAAAAAGAVVGGKQIKKKIEERKAGGVIETESDGYNPEAELEKAIERVRDLESDVLVP